MTRVVRRQRGRSIGSGLACPPCNIGPLSTPDYAALAAQAMHQLGGGITVFAGQRAEGFYVDLGVDLRPGRPAAVREPARPVRPARVLRPRARGERHQPPERALDRDPGADLRADQERPPDHRRVDHGEPPAGPAVGRRQRRERRQRPVPAGVAARQPAGQRGADPARAQGPVELAAAVGRQAVRRPTSPIPTWRRCCPSCTRACSRNLAALVASGEAARRPGGDPAHRHPLRAHPRIPELHRARCWPTCSG